MCVFICAYWKASMFSGNSQPYLFAEWVFPPLLITLCSGFTKHTEHFPFFTVSGERGTEKAGKLFLVTNSAANEHNSPCWGGNCTQYITSVPTRLLTCCFNRLVLIIQKCLCMSKYTRVHAHLMQLFPACLCNVVHIICTSKQCALLTIRNTTSFHSVSSSTPSHTDVYVISW